MNLTAGTTIGPYEVRDALGAGGMGEVYRARDAALGRDVALKILPDVFAADADRLARFEREAQALAALNHPNIAQVYAIERLPAEAGATAGRAIVMEFVEGEDLSVRIGRGAIPLEEALPIARQIATALEAAHDAGIIHRDLKPANIKVRPDGTAKVLDFGLAKAMGGAMSGDGPGGEAGRSPAYMTPANSPTLTARATELGVVLGTAAYMAPEQAKGKAVDRRADVWAFGVVLYEMLAGRRAFGGDDVTEVMAAVIRDTPDLEALPASTPTPVRRLLRRCLQKDARKRLRDMGDAGVELDEAMTAPPAEESGRVAAVADRAGVRSARRSPMAWVAATILLAVVAGAAAWALKPAPAVDHPVTRFSIVLDEGQELGNRNVINLTWSRDGRRLAYRASGKLYIRSLEDLEPHEVPGAPAGAGQWFLPDGDGLLLRAPTGLLRIATTGGPTQEIATGLTDFNGLDWIDDQTIVYADATRLIRVATTGGASATLVTVPPPGGVAFPQVLPGGRLLYLRATTPSEYGTVVRPLDGSGEDTMLLPGVGGVRYVPTGHLVYGLGNRLMAVPFDVDTLQVKGAAIAMPEQVFVSPNTLLAAAAVSPTGALAYMPSDEGQVLRLSWIAAQDQSTPVVTVPRNYSDPVLSPDGRRVALHLYDEDNDVWVADLSRGNLTRLTFGPDEEETPAWSPDGTQVVFAAQRENTRVLVSKPADGGAAAPERTIWQASEHFHVDGWSPDGKTILLEVKRAKTKGDIVAVDVESGETKDVIASSFDEYNARLSHDGRWLAFVSDESGRPEVYVQPYPALTTRALVSTAGGVEPVWSRDGRQLFFRTTDNVMVAAFTSTAPLEFGQPRVFAADRFARTQGSTHTHYDAGPDGRLLMIENPPDRKSGQQRLQVVLNWFEELTRLVPVK